ncbi:hypothetical protein [Klenkia taihuensis]|uniref:Uncharacterized protein n=1 Tax=Klenkia taihuensis TaxID=1225127 RepID=A0A1I1J080_9ACTN|nr:hypothetical protein [Klenkia taihuensis]GHE11284.1 hypothetical protein GCM10011381_24170 [Klenkia taihuensis]SFC39313.1 hypothetical protein SAMN05661030_0856 [Klenkia taihuensis]
MQPPADEATSRWPGPSLYTLLAWVEVELLLESGARVDAAHAVVTYGAESAFGPGWVSALCAAAATEGVPMDDGFPVLAELRTDEDRALRVLDRLHAWMRSRAGVPGAPPAPRDDLRWSAVRPGSDD